MKQPGATLIGVFVLGAMALVVAAILFFGSGNLFRQHIAIVSYFPGSVAGLRVGAPVTYRGVRLGEVKFISIRLDPDPTRAIAQVNMELLPEAVKIYGLTVHDIPALVERGLSARLVMQSFVTGQLQVELDFRAEVRSARVGGSTEVPEIPTVPSRFQALTEQIEGLDIAAAVATFQRTLNSLDAILASPALKQTVDDLPALVADLRRTARKIDREVAAFSAVGQSELTQSSAALQKTLGSVRSLAQNLDREAAATLTASRATLQKTHPAIDGANMLLDPRGATVIQLQRTVDDLAATTARLRSFAERIDRNPSVLLRGR